MESSKRTPPYIIDFLAMRRARFMIFIATAPPHTQKIGAEDYEKKKDKLLC